MFISLDSMSDSLLQRELIAPADAFTLPGDAPKASACDCEAEGATAIDRTATLSDLAMVLGLVSAALFFFRAVR